MWLPNQATQQTTSSRASAESMRLRNGAIVRGPVAVCARRCAVALLHSYDPNVRRHPLYEAAIEFESDSSQVVARMELTTIRGIRNRVQSATTVCGVSRYGRLEPGSYRRPDGTMNPRFRRCTNSR